MSRRHAGLATPEVKGNKRYLKSITLWILALLGVPFLSATCWAQGHGSISGTITDPSNAVVPNANVTLTQVATAVERSFVSGPDGFYSFPDIPPGNYTLKVTAAGFQSAETSVSVRVNQLVRTDLQLALGASTETVNVTAEATQINFEDATQQAGIAPEVLQELPLLLGGGPRRATDFVLLVPGANTGGTDDAFATRFNGGLQAADDAQMDGISMIQGTISNNGMIAFEDFAISPEMVQEVKVLTSNYEPQYGTTNSAVIQAQSKSGTSEYHGGIFWNHFNTALNARQFGVDEKGKNIQNNYGGFIGGKVPGLNRGNMKTFFYYLNERFRIRGGVSRPTISIPSLKQRQGDFTDWVDASGNLIPIFDPLTTRTLADGTIVRDQFMGCNGTTPNVICPDRIQNSLAKQWFQHLPNPTNDQALNNYLAPALPVDESETNLATNMQMIKIDHHPGENDHVAFMFRPQRHPSFEPPCALSRIICEGSWTPPKFLERDLYRANWDHTFSPTLLNTLNFGILHWYLADEAINAPFANELPQLPGVEHRVPSQITFSDGFYGFGGGIENAEGNQARIQNYIFTNLTTWVRGKHTLKFGGEYRYLANQNPEIGDANGTFNFGREATGLLDINSGSPIASFLLESVGSASAFVRSIESTRHRMDAYILHVGDTWRTTPKLTVNYGLRWDLHRPSWTTTNQNSFFDPNKPNPGAGGRLGALAFAGTEHGEASFGRRYPENLFKKAFSPRLGIAYAVDSKTVVRAGYGIFFSQPYYAGWGAGISTAGFSAQPEFSSTRGGLEPAFLLSQGFPQNFQKPPVIDPSFQNGQSIQYRDFNGNRLTYSQQWNLTIERQLGPDFHLSLAYVANKGTRLPSSLAAINTLDPKYLSLGNALFDEFEPGQASLHGVQLPYDGWVEQMQGCAPSLAQALLPYPQFCDSMQSGNEYAGNSTYHSFQLKLEKRLSEGLFVLGSYTLSKNLTTTIHAHESQTGWGLSGVFSPFERQRGKSLAHDDVPHVLSVAWVYELPFGPTKRFRSSSGVLNRIMEGWEINGTFRASSGLPAFFRSSQCNVPDQLRAACIPALKPGADPFLASKGGFDPGDGRPLFNVEAFEPIESFNFYTGAGPRVSNVRMFGFTNTNLSLHKTTRISEKVRFQLRADFFNVWNQHIFTASGQEGSMAYTNDLASPEFGFWNGSVTSPRNIQVGARLEF
jgi:type 1 fimbria pilin